MIIALTLEIIYKTLYTIFGENLQGQENLLLTLLKTQV